MMYKEEKQNEIDEGLFERIASGDDEAFAELYYATYKQVFAFLLSLTKNREDAEDLLQNTYIKVRNGSHLYNRQGTPKAWIMKIAKNLYLDYVRKYGKCAQVDYELVENYISENNSNYSENKMIIHDALKKLNEQETTIIVMHIYDGLKHKEIAEILGMPLATVLSKYNRSLKKMRKVIEG